MGRKWKAVDTSNLLAGVGGFGGLEELSVEDFDGNLQKLIQEECNQGSGSVLVEQGTLDQDFFKSQKRKKRKKQEIEEDFDEDVTLQSAGKDLNDEGKSKAQQPLMKKSKKRKTSKNQMETEEDKTKDIQKNKQKPKKPKKKKQVKQNANQTEADNKQNQQDTQEQDTSIDMYAWDQFNLHPQIIQALANLKFSTPTPIQQQCLVPAINGRCDIIGAAQTGSGKTLAFGLPILQLIMDIKLNNSHDKSLKALIVAPTRELVMQVCAHLQVIGKNCGIQVSAIVGGISAAKQERILKKRPEIVVGTPGRLWELMSEGNEHLSDVSNLKFFVLDEADRMMQMGLFKELQNILAMLPYPSHLQDFQEEEEQNKVGEQEQEDDDDDEVTEEEEEEEELEEEGNDDKQEEQEEDGDDDDDDDDDDEVQEGATLALPANLKSRLRRGKDGGAGGKSPTLEILLEQLQFRGKPKIVDLTPTQKVAEKVQESYMQCLENNRDSFVYYIVANHTGRTLVFCTSIAAVKRVVEIMKLLGIGVWGLHAQQQQRQRLKNLDRFRNDPQGVLVATDVAARGLDILDVQCVVHYQLPASADTYIHRAGRTARVEAEGISIALVSPKEMPRFKALIFALERKQLPPEFPIDSSLLPKVMQRSQLAEEIMLLEREVKGKNLSKSWIEKNAVELDLDMSGDEDSDGGSRVRKKKENEANLFLLRQKLMDLLSEPLLTSISKKFLAGGYQLDNGNNVRSGVEIAEKLAAHQRAAVVASTSKKQQQQQNDYGKSGKQKKKSLKQMQKEALQEAVTKKLNKKGGKKRVFTVSSKTMVGRQEFGPNALETLKRKLSLIP